MGVSRLAGRGLMSGLWLAALLLAGCPAPKEAISVSQESYDFGTRHQSWNVEVWNSNPSVTDLAFTVTPSDTWIHCDPTSGDSTGPQDFKVITVSVSRHGLSIGTYQGNIEFSGRGVKAKQVSISMYSDGSEGAPGSNLNITGLAQHFSSPYLLDFSFSLRDNAGTAIVGEPAQFQVACMEDDVAVSADESPPYFAKASLKQMKCALVLDYSASMASVTANGDSNNDGVSDAIDAMQNAVKTIFLPALSASTEVAVFEFHRETTPRKVCDFTVDKAFAARQIDAIWSDYVMSFWGVSRCWDAVYAGIEAFVLDRLDYGGFSSSFDRETYTRALSDHLVARNIDLVAMAGFGTITTASFHEAFPERVLNTHPSLLPAFKGWHAVRDALAAGATETGCTVHIATAQLDDGPILAQRIVPIKADDDEESLHERIKSVERSLYPEVVLAARGTASPGTA